MGRTGCGCTAWEDLPLMAHADEGGRRAEGGHGTRAGLLTLGLSGHRGKAWSDDTSQLGPDKHARDVPSLDKYAEERWEVRPRDPCVSACAPTSRGPRAICSRTPQVVLHFMVGSPSAAVSQDLAQLLSQAGLMKR